MKAFSFYIILFYVYNIYSIINLIDLGIQSIATYYSTVYGSVVRYEQYAKKIFNTTSAGIDEAFKKEPF